MTSFVQAVTVNLCNFLDLSTPPKLHGNLAVYHGAIRVKDGAQKMTAICSQFSNDLLSVAQHKQQIQKIIDFHNPTVVANPDAIRWLQQHVFPVCGFSMNQTHVLNPYEALMQKFGTACVSVHWHRPNSPSPHVTHMLCTPTSVLLIYGVNTQNQSIYLSAAILENDLGWRTLAYQKQFSADMYIKLVQAQSTMEIQHG